jgi:hypothetical protein
MISCTFKETFFVFFLGLTQLCDAPRRAAKQPYKYGCLDTDERMLRSAYQNAVEETQHLEAGNLMGGKHDVGLSRLSLCERECCLLVLNLVSSTLSD